MSAGPGQPRRRRHEEDHEEHVNHEAWAIPYADMVTLLMALFLMLFAISSIDLAKFEKMAASLQGTLTGGGEVVVGPGGQGDGVLDGASPPVAPAPTPAPTPAEQALAREEARAAAATAEAEQLEGVRRQVAAHAGALGHGDAVGFRTEARGLVITILADDVLFAPGAATLQPAGAGVLAEVAAALAAVPNQVMVEGHTDDRPIATSAHPSNWELSTARAASVLRVLVDDLGLDPRRVSAAGYGQERPLAPNDTPEGRARNRRVEIAVLAEVAPA